MPKTPLIVVPTVALACLAGCGQLTDTAAAPSPDVAPVVAPSDGAAASVQRQFEDIVKAVSPSVVQVQTQGGLGSGVVLDGGGDIVTNAHVVGSATSFVVTVAN